MKVFAASIAACSDESGERITNHISVLLIYETIEEAAKEAERIAFLNYKEKDWYGHSASITVANAEFYEACEVNRRQGLWVPDNRGLRNFYFDQLDAEILT